MGPILLDPDFMLYGQHHSSVWPPKQLGAVFYKNPEIDKLIEEARKAQDPKIRRNLYKKVSIMVWEDALWIFLYFHIQKYTIVHRKNGTGLVVLPVEKFNPVYTTIE